MCICEYMLWRTDIRVGFSYYAFVVDLYIFTPYHHYEGMVVRCTFSRSTHTPRSYFTPCGATLRLHLPISATLVIEPLILRRLRWGYEWSYNLSEAIGNSLIKFRIADKRGKWIVQVFAAIQREKTLSL